MPRPLYLLLAAAALTAALIQALPAAPPAPVSLRCEYLEDSMVAGTPQPRFHWNAPDTARGARPAAYQALVSTHASVAAGDRWHSGRAAPPDSTHIVYAGKLLAGGQIYYSKVRYWDHTGAGILGAKRLLPYLAAGGNAGLVQDISGQAGEYMQAMVRMDRFTGSVLVAKDGKPLFRSSYGLANREHGVPNRPDTKFRLGSITKQFTAAAILQLEERGKLKLEDTLDRYAEPCPEGWKSVTIRHLLTHTSGIPSYTGLKEFQAKWAGPWTMDTLLALVRDKPLEFPPGEKWAYNNTGYVLLGAIVEKVSGKKYDAYMRENVFDPLGMKNSGYDWPQTVLVNRAQGYRKTGDGYANAQYLDMMAPHGAGALYSTVDDLLLWDQALYTEKLLKRESIEKMFTPVKNNYAFGWMVRQEMNRKSVAHGGGIHGFNTILMRFPEEKLLVVALSNLESPAVGKIGRDLAAIALGEKYEVPAPRREVTLDPRRYDALVGKYQLAPNFILAVRRQGDRLMTQATGQPEVEVFPESDTKFFLKVVDARITFVMGANGNAESLILHQNGRDMPARKIE